MTRRFMLLLPLLCLACTLTAPPIPPRAGSPSPTPSRRAERAATGRALDPTPTATPAPAACKVTAWRLFVRADPMRETRALGVLSQGDRALILLTPTPAGARWLPVQYGELAGWVYSDYCEAIP